VFVLPDLEADLAALIASVPTGKVTTPRALAEALGLPQAAVWVAKYTLAHPHNADCACHRVVRAGGVLGGYLAGGIEAKQQRLLAEGVPVVDGRVDLSQYGVRPQLDQPPLAALLRLQNELADQLSTQGVTESVETVGGIDASYAGSLAVAVYVLCAWPSGEVLWTTTVTTPVKFPYLPTLLTFRELPAMLPALEAARSAGKLPDVLLVDGAGRLHPRSAGIAAHLGVVADLPTVGVTKRLLHGTPDDLPTELRAISLVRVQGEPAGFALQPPGRSSRPVYVSPGHRTSLELALRVAPPLWKNRRLPEPIYWADRLSREEAKRRASEQVSRDS
jgi:deoxyribonuclease V